VGGVLRITEVMFGVVLILVHGYSL
jgi:hypothetical protein